MDDLERSILLKILPAIQHCLSNTVLQRLYSSIPSRASWSDDALMPAQSGRRSVAEEGNLIDGSTAASSKYRMAQCSEFNELFWIMGEVEALFVGHRSDAPLLHSQRPE